MMGTKTKLLKKICGPLLTLAFLNFSIFFIIGLILGGDAVNGKINNGKYYVGNHGVYTEVSKATYSYSRYHTYSVWATHSLAFISVGLLIAIKKIETKPKKR